MQNFKTFLFMTGLTVLLVVVGGAMTRSRPLSEEEVPQVYRIVRRLCRNANLPIPAIYLTPPSSPTPSRPAAGPAAPPSR